jgi:hypothetical protein
VLLGKDLGFRDRCTGRLYAATLDVQSALIPWHNKFPLARAGRQPRKPRIALVAAAGASGQVGIRQFRELCPRPLHVYSIIPAFTAYKSRKFFEFYEEQRYGRHLPRIGTLWQPDFVPGFVEKA